jgi:phosphatidylglycerophosphatase A
MKNFYKIFSSGFGSGFSPIAPGTAGSIVACFVLYFLNLLFPSEDSLMTTYLIIHFTIIIVFTVIGIIAVNNLEKEWGEDSPKFVIDEFVGMWLSVLFLPFNWKTLIIGFVAFRFFDILKPFGIRSLEKLRGGLGVMMDDVLAGIYANIIVRTILFASFYFNMFKN